jgi:2-polyprenyl-3-methyl-5-hydroxy-6-metoxy-1,4-benzoquinol methylase
MFVNDRGNSHEELRSILFECRPCPLCGSDCSKQIYPINKDFPSRLSGFDLSQIDVGVASCVCCGHQFIQPVPTPRFLAAYYASYMTEAKDNFYRHRQLVEIPAAFRLKYGERLSRIGHVIGSNGRLLDVGCGLGMFLRLAKEHGYKVSGVEANRSAVERLHDDFGIDAANCLFEDFETDQQFAVVTMWDLLEHMGDPVAALRKAYLLLRPGGVLVVETPARDSVVHWIAKLAYHLSFRKLLAPLYLTYGLHHLQYFSSRSLADAVAAIGFEVVCIEREATSLDDLGATHNSSLLGKGKALLIKVAFALAAATGKTNKMVLFARRPIASASMAAF